MPPRPRESQPPDPAPGGPYVQAAMLCEKVLRDADGVQSYIRVVDQITVAATGPDPPEDMPPTAVNLTAVVVLKAGEARGRYAVRFRPEGPDGIPRPALEVTLTFEGEGERGHNVNIDLSGLQLDQTGLWWFDILWGHEERLMTRIPLRLRYQPQRVQAIGQAGEPSES